MKLSLTTDDRPPLSSLDRDGARMWAEKLNQPAYRGDQLWSALNLRGVQDVEQITGFPKALREELRSSARLRSVEVITHLVSAKDGAEKVLFRLRGGVTVESVLIPGRNAGGGQRYTVCVSSQAGCPAACSFCATGLAGFVRNLSTAEIVDQIMFFVDQLKARDERVNNVVYMGMGEPFLNVPSVASSIARICDPGGLGLGERHVTVSTVGIVPQIERFGSWGGQVNLAVSLHAPNDELRSRLVPYNHHFPLADLMTAVRGYTVKSGRRVSFEYVLLRGVNDTIALARELGKLIHPFGGLAHVNVIPWNPFREGRFIRSEGPDADTFVDELRSAGINATIRYSKGLDISAACGQLRDQPAANV